MAQPRSSHLLRLIGKLFEGGEAAALDEEQFFRERNDFVPFVESCVALVACFDPPKRFESDTDPTFEVVAKLRDDGTTIEPSGLHSAVDQSLDPSLE